MLNTQINFKRGKTKYKFDLFHNLHEFGLSIDVALINWSARTSDFSEQSFIDYVKSKGNQFVCVSKKEYKKTGK